MSKEKLRRVTVYLPEHIYNILSDMKKKREIRSISSAVRMVLSMYFRFGAPTLRTRVIEQVTITREYEIQQPLLEERVPIYGEAQKEIMSQLKNAIAEYIKRRKKKDC